MQYATYNRFLPYFAILAAFFGVGWANISFASLPAVWDYNLACYQWQGNCYLNVLSTPSSTLQAGDTIRSISAIFNGNVDGGSCTTPAYLFLYLADQYGSIYATSSYVDVSSNCGTNVLQTVSFPAPGITVSSTDTLGLGWTYADVGRRTVGSVYFYGQAGANLDFVFPVNNTTTLDFNNWIVDYTADTTSTDYLVKISYTTASGTALYDQATLPNVGSSTVRISIPKSNLLNLQGSSSTVWAAYATLYDDKGLSLGYSSPIYFTVVNNLPTSDCDPSDGSFWGDVKYGVCKSMVWLFYPSDRIKSYPGDLKASISKKPPFGWGSDLYTAFQNTGSSSTSTTLVSSSTINNLSPFFTPIYTTLTTIIYIMGAWWTYNRFRHLEI